MRWIRSSITKAGHCWPGDQLNQLCHPHGTHVDDEKTVHAADCENHSIMGWKYGATSGQVVAGGNGRGNQLNRPTYIFVDMTHSVYVSDANNHRVMKWIKNAKEGIIVAGGQGQINALNQLSKPYGVITDQLDNVDVIDHGNNRVMRWSSGATEGDNVIDGNGPDGLSYDRQGSLYVADNQNHRVQRFNITSSSQF